MKNSILFVFHITLIVTAFGGSLAVIPQGGRMYDLRGIPAPYNFYHYQELVTGERLAVGGDGHFYYLPNLSPDAYRGKVASVDLNGIYFVNPKKGWVVGIKGSIYRTEDIGRTWTKQESNVKSELLAISCVNENRCWVTGEDGVILTTQNGKDWTRLDSGFKSDLFAVDFLDEMVGLAVGDDALILRTDDGGVSWRKQPIMGGAQTCRGQAFSDSSLYLSGVTIFDSETAWVAGNYGIARYSKDTGRWEGQCLRVVSGLVGIVSQDGKSVFAISSWGENVVSRDSGRTWSVFVPPLDPDFPK